MLGSVLRPGVIAIAGGILVAIALAVPFVAAEYRRFGQLTTRSVLTGLAVAVYGCALASYTLLPLPVGGPDFCTRYDVPAQPIPFRFVLDVLHDGVGSFGAVVRNAALAQVLLNVVLFLPLGVFLRRATRWPVGAVAATGLGVSLLIETTQLTGIWGLFPCAYRVADVDDLIANTSGALLGALAAPLLGRGRPAVAPAADRPTTVSLGRRLIGMACDVVAVLVVGGLATLVWSLALAIAGQRLPQPATDLLGFATGTLVPAALQLVVLMVSGQTVGEQAVRLQPATRPSRGRLLIRWAAGIGGWTISAAGPAGIVATLLALASLVAVIATRDRSGLAYLAAGMRVRTSPPPAIGDRTAPETVERHEP